MTRPAGVGPIGETIDRLRLAIADSEAFRKWVGAASRLEALDKIFGPVLPAYVDAAGEIPVAELERLRPFASVYIPDGGLTLQRDSESPGVQGFSLGATVNVQLEQAASLDHANDDEAAEVEFSGVVGRIAKEVFEMSGVAPYADVMSVSLETAPFRANARKTPQLGECFAAELAFQIGTAVS